MLSKSEILNTLKNQKSAEVLKGIRIGLAGSYAKGEETEKSDIDIVLDGDSQRIEAAVYVKQLFQKEVDVLWLELLKQEDQELDDLLMGSGLEPNPYSVYKTVKEEVIWI